MRISVSQRQSSGSVVFWNMTQFNFTSGYQIFGLKHLLRYLGRRVNCPADGHPEHAGDTFLCNISTQLRIIWHHNPQDHNPRLHRHENLEPRVDPSNNLRSLSANNLFVCRYVPHVCYTGRMQRRRTIDFLGSKGVKISQIYRSSLQR